MHIIGHPQGMFLLGKSTKQLYGLSIGTLLILAFMRVCIFSGGGQQIDPDTGSFEETFAENRDELQQLEREYEEVGIETAEGEGGGRVPLLQKEMIFLTILNLEKKTV